MRRIILAAIVGFSATLSAQAGGSMSREVSIIYVEPTYEVQQQSRINVLRKEMKAEARADRRFQQQLVRDAIRDQRRQALEADRAYYKKLADQRKARKK